MNFQKIKINKFPEAKVKQIGIIYSILIIILSSIATITGFKKGGLFRIYFEVLSIPLFFHAAFSIYFAFRSYLEKRILGPLLNHTIFGIAFLIPAYIYFIGYFIEDHPNYFLLLLFFICISFALINFYLLYLYVILKKSL